jgi:hypothetical protein
MTETTERFGVGTMVSSGQSTDVNILHEFDLDTYSRYLRAFNNALAPTYRFTARLVERNFQSYVDHENFAGRLIELGRNFGTVDRRALGESVMTQIVNWLTSFRLYLDYAETNLKRQFGNESDEVAIFKRRTAEAYDDHVGYRFIYRFRNYVQHCSLPLSALTLRASNVSSRNPFLKQAASFLIRRDDLLANFDWGPKHRADLAAMDETFRLRPLAQDAMDQLRGIERLLIDTAINEAARTITDAREALLHVPPDALGVPSLIRFITETDAPDGPIRTLNPIPLSREMVEQYERVAAGEIQAADVHSAAESPPPPVFDVTTVRERFRRDDRAVQAMSLWQVEGGGTPAFQAGVDRMVKEDQSVEPLLTGLFNMTAVLLHMTAATLGVRPDGLLGGLLDIYAGQSDVDGEDVERNGG